jgi:hypothetical protein
MNKTKEANEQTFLDFLTDHFGRELKNGDIIEAQSSDKNIQYQVDWIEYIGKTFRLHCYVIKDGQVIDTIRKSLGTGYNYHYWFTKKEIQSLKFKLA